MDRISPVNIIAFTTTNWHSKEQWDAMWHPSLIANPKDFDRSSTEQWLSLWNSQPRFSLTNWMNRVRWLFDPIKIFLACGTWSDPSFSPLTVVNSGVDFTKPYNPRRWSYAGCAQTAAHAYLLNRRDWDLAVQLDYDCMIGAVDFAELMRQFCLRSDLIMTPNWFGKPGGPFIMFKREGISRWMHSRRRANLMEDDIPEPMELEDEFGEIFKGAWFNPFPDNNNQRYEGGVTDEQAMPWPFVRIPSASMQEEYLRTQTSRAKSVIADGEVRA